MIIQVRNVWQRFKKQGERQAPERAVAPVEPMQTAALAVDIAPNDPLLTYFQSSPGVVEIERLSLESPALRALKEAGVKLAVPLVSQGELIGLINLGPRLSQQEYSADDRKLLDDLATQAAPAVRVAQLVREQEIEARQRERLEQELRVARLIQQTLLPKEVPNLEGWEVSAYYQPARAVGGDFYDFLYFPDGLVGLVVGDVTDKGVPAALVMATTRTLLRGAAERLVAPGQVLQRVNELLHVDIPAKMFVTCLYALLDPATGHLRYANAGHDVPYRRTADGVVELRATGMPLGLMPGMQYEEKETTLAPGESILFYSDGLVEAHSPTGDMFGFPYLRELMADHPGGATLVGYLLDQLADFTGAGWEQEDDVTLVTLEYTMAAREEVMSSSLTQGDEGTWQVLAEFDLPSEPGNERRAMTEVAAVVEALNLPPRCLERLKTAVAEATMNAMEHGNKYQAELPASIQVLASPTAVGVRITDRGGGQPIPEAEVPDLEAKLAGLQSPRGWGLFLIKNMVDEMRVTSDDVHHTIELVIYREEGDKDGNSTEAV